LRGCALSAEFRLSSQAQTWSLTAGTPPYSETDPVNPVNVYGEQKAMAEEKTKLHHPHPFLLYDMKQPVIKVTFFLC
jgi:UDP-glucose 4-epimerase